VGQFTRAAFEVLKREMRPLTAREITDIATREGRLRSSGKTPWQTMKSKLSTDTLSRGSDSLFMRVEEGRFSLREWKGLYPEDVAQRFQKALFDREALLRECRPMRRREAEEDRAVTQLVSVFVVRFQDKYLTYKRTKRLPESRLHGYYSLAFGGHLNPDDLRPLLNIFDPDLAAPLLLRELGEELRLDPQATPILEYRGLLYDDSRDVSKQHLGITYPTFSLAYRRV
jgi:predicted NUDIX family phosphoesterase